MDVQTLFIAAALSSALSGILLLLGRTRQGMDALAWWGIAMILGSAGLLLRVAPLPDLLTFVVAKALLLLIGPVAWTAVRVFAGRRPAPWRALAGPAIWLLLCVVPGFREWDAAQLTISCAIGSCYVFITAATLRGVRNEGLPSTPLALVLLYVHACVYAVRAVMAATGLDAGLDEPITAAMLLEAILHTIGMAIVLVAMTNERAERNLEHSLADARAAGESRARFVAHMSHEVRTPLNGMLGVAQLLRSDPSLRADHRQHVAMLETAGRHLLAIVNDALDIAKIDADRLDIASEPLDPRQAAQDCVTLVRPSAAAKHLDLTLDLADDLRSVLGDGLRLRQILLNLAWNAVKFTPAGGSVTLRVRHAEALCFEVIDSGPGVPPEKQPLLFQEFSQLELQDSGTGLGLSLSARLARRMGGSLAYTPGPGGVGSLFRLTLPWPIAVEAGAPPLTDAVAQGRDGLDLLVVDDVPVNRHLLRSILSLDDHRVAEARSGAEAMAMIADRPFDAVLMDLRMPDMDGLEVTRRVRAMPSETAQVPIVGVSADVMPDVVEACRDAGMDAMLAKPIDRQALREALARVSRAAAA